MGNFNYLFLQAYNNYTEGLYDLALSTLNDAELNFSPDEENNFSLEDLYILRGTIFFGINNLEKARLDFENALKANPSSSEACLGLGRYFNATGQLENAKTMIEWAVQYNEGHEGARNALEEINVKLDLPPNHSSLAEASAPSEPAQKWGPLDEATQLFSEKKYNDAITRLLDARKEQEEILGSIENFIAFNYLELYDMDGAKNAAERALKLNPLSSQAHATLGEIYLRDQKYPDAKKMFEIALLHNPENNFAKTGLQNTFDALGMNGNNNKANNLKAVNI
ncbi:MAG: tetratricopeptide repeat protein [Ignavibacteriaceae bacterium]|nr:tetratricopeptide repeat protein [Ignavibacteriaceae bacterium]